ncbi:ZAR1-like protein [Grus japonensis]|uniref:ZAR1-like protein n=1 Tax=Grus japonensis TaxID=30415 RepID=A0ABC9W5A8_GRUJA
MAMIMESFVYPPFSTYQSFRGSLTPSRSGDPTVKQPSWKQGKSGGISPFLGGPLTPMPSDYLESYRRAQLQALLSHVSPGLTMRLRRANTKEVGVQVNLRADAAVQCSLGPRTLPVGRPLSPAALRTQGRLALYSPVPDRRLFTLPEATALQEKEEVSETTPEEQKAEDGSREQQEGQAQAALPSEETAEAPREEAAAPRQRAAFQVCSAGTPGPEERLALGAASSGWGGEPQNRLERNLLLSSKRHSDPHPGFLPRSAPQVYFKQLCRKCQKGFNPYRVEAIQCQAFDLALDNG